MSKKLNIKNSLTDNTLDLSMNDLQEVPVKEIASCTKATILDLSNNKIVTLGKLFPSSLTHLIKLDLNSNQLTSLPDNFGLLVHLKHLDLYHNKLKTLPLSFGNLKMLRWLDLKDNPLDPKLAEVSGPCLDAQQCQYAAKNVVNYLDRALKVAQQKEKEIEEKRLLAEKNKADGKNQASQSQKKKKSKNKNTNKENTETLNSLTKGEIDAVVEEVDSESNKIQDNDCPKKGGLSICSVLSTIFKFLAFIIMISLFLLFIISLFDEPSYNRISANLSKSMKSVGSKLPKSVTSAVNRNIVLAGKFGRRSLKNFLSFSQVLLSRTYELYLETSNYLSSSVYLDAMKTYWHMTYIKSVEFVSSLLNSLFATDKHS